VAAASGGGCVLCGARAVTVAARLGVCGACVARDAEGAQAHAARVHAEARAAFRLPTAPPATPGGVRCPLCARACQIGAGERGFCGLRTTRGGRLVHLAGTASRGLLDWYRDALPTNCVADWVCSGSAQIGRHNLAVFYASCTLDCLFCQNWHYRAASPTRDPGMSAAELAAAANEDTYCVCFFGGDPASQMPHAIATGQRLAKRGITVCWETAGTSSPALLDHAVALSLETGGCIKFDLKAYDDALHRVLTGASNARTLENFVRAAKRASAYPKAPVVVASTLLVPGYVDATQVGRIARFIAGVNPDIPYALLAFAPHFYMDDLPPTSATHAAAALAEAQAAGLTNVRIGNRHLLSQDY
jgi:pyruvate formate lyase activating enzyme